MSDRERERERDRQTDRQTDRPTEIMRDKEESEFVQSCSPLYFADRAITIDRE